METEQPPTTSLKLLTGVCTTIWKWRRARPPWKSPVDVLFGWKIQTTQERFSLETEPAWSSWVGRAGSRSTSPGEWASRARHVTPFWVLGGTQEEATTWGEPNIGVGRKRSPFPLQELNQCHPGAAATSRPRVGDLALFLGIMYLNCHNPYPQSKIHIRSYSTIHIRIYSTIHNHASLCYCSTLQNLLKSLYLPLAPEQYLSACSLLCVLLSEHNAIFHKLCDKHFMICLKNTKVKN